MRGVQVHLVIRGAQNRVGNANLGQASGRFWCYIATENRVALDEEQLLFIAGGQDNRIDEDMDEQPVQDLALNVDNVFQADDCDAFDYDVDEAPTAQTMFLANLLSADPVYDEAGLSYDSDILSEVHDHDHYQDAVCEHHEEHEMHDDVQPNYVVDSHANYTSDSNMIPYDQYVKDNAVPVVQSNVSSVPNDAYMMIFNDMHEPHAQSVSDITRNTVVDNSLTAELATYKEQVELYERRARKFEKELHSVKMKLASTINYNKSMVEEVTSLKKDFKQKENKHLEEFLDMKALKEKPALYNGYEIIKNNHVSALVHNTEDTLEIAEITRRKINDKMKDPKYVTHKVKIAPPDYSKENYLATFTPQKQLTLEQIFWSQDLIKMKEEALKKQTTASRPIKALTVYPPNTPAMLVPRVLPTKSQGIQKALTKEIKEMKDIFEELEAEVDQNVVNRKHDEIERKNLLIANDNLIADCLFKEVFYIATNSELTISRLTEMHEAHTIVQTRCLELEAELSKLRDKVQKDDHIELVKHFSNLEITHAKHIEQTTALLTENELLKAQIHENLKCNTMESVKPRALAPGRTDHPLGIWTQAIRKLSDGEIALRSSRNLHDKFIVIVRFMNDHFGAIMGYGDYVISDSMISRVYYVEGLGHNLFFVRQFCDSDLEVAFRKHSCYVRDTDDVELIKGSRGSNLYTISIEDMMKSSPICLLSKASRKIMVMASSFKPFELREDLGKLQLTADIGIFVGYAPSRKGIGPAPTFLMPGHISSGLVPNPVPAAPYVPPKNKELEILFQPMFDVDTWRTSTLSSSLPSRVEGMGSPAPAVQFQFLVFFPGVNSSWEDNPFAPVVNDPFINVFAPEPSSKASSSGDLLSTRKQLATDALWCLYNSVPSKVKPKNFKSVITKDSWFQAMQDEIYEFDRL
ncbi:hypothetical protein Tco_0785349 [Tanacetum coccineum]